MNRKSLVIVLALALALAAAGITAWRAGVWRASASTVQPDAAALALLPAQSTTIFGLDLDGLRHSQVYASWRQRARQKGHDKEYEEFLARTGFDLERDLESVTAGSWKNGGEPVFLAVVTARFNPSSLAAYLREKGGVTENYQGFEIFSFDGSHQAGQGPGAGGPAPAPGGRPPRSRGALVLLDDRTILAGTPAAMKQALDLKRQPGPSVLNNTALIERVRKIGAENQIWAVSTAPGSFLPSQVPLGPGTQANLGRILQGLGGSTFAINAAGGLRLLMEGNCASDEDARMLADAARGLLAVMRLAAPANRPEALEVLNSFQVEQQERQVRVTAQISSQLLDALAEKPQMFIPRGPQAGPGERHKK